MSETALKLGDLVWLVDFINIRIFFTVELIVISPPLCLCENRAKMKGFSPWPGKVRLITQNTELDTTKNNYFFFKLCKILEDSYSFYYLIYIDC